MEKIMRMRKRDAFQEIHTRLIDGYGYPTGSTMFLYIMQKRVGLNFAAGNKMIEQELTFLRNSSKPNKNIGAIFEME
jgi:hypothetical protein